MPAGSAPRTAIGLDVGGTKIVGAVVDREGRILSRQRVDTPADGDRRTAALIALVRQLRAAHDLTEATVGVGAAGLVAGGALMLTLGTGVGGGLVMDGRLVRGADGLAAEFGHMILADGGAPCPCGNRGCLEAYASGTAIGRAAREAAAAGTLPAGSPLYDLEDLTGADVTTAARAGDAGARGILADAGRWLGVGIASLVNSLDPEVVIVGGGVMDAGALLLEFATAAYHERVIARVHRRVPPVVTARLGDDAGVIGAALLGADPAP